MDTFTEPNPTIDYQMEAIMGHAMLEGGGVSSLDLRVLNNDGPGHPTTPSPSSIAGFGGAPINEPVQAVNTGQDISALPGQPTGHSIIAYPDPFDR
jgi:hypothetical protein